MKNILEFIKPKKKMAIPKNSTDREEERQKYVRREKFIITDLICDYLPKEERFTILDGGAREATEDLRWRGYERSRLRFYGFEVDAQECEKLNKTVPSTGVDCRYFPIGLWSGPGRRKFYETASPGASSLLPVNTKLIERWKMQDAKNILLPREAMKVVKTYETDVDNLNNWAKKYSIPDVDFLKLNIQGAELEVLKGADDILDKILGMQIEISFVESYDNRPFFSDVDPVIRSKNFEFFDIVGHHYLGREASPVTSRHLPGLLGLFGQFIEGHAVYFRDPIHMERCGIDVSHFSKIKLLKLVSMAEIYHQIEYAIELLYWIEKFLEKQGDCKSAKEVKELTALAVQKYLTYMAPQ